MDLRSGRPTEIAISRRHIAAPSVAGGGAHGAARDGASVAGGDRASGGPRPRLPAEGPRGRDRAAGATASGANGRPATGDRTTAEGRTWSRGSTDRSGDSAARTHQTLDPRTALPCVFPPDSRPAAGRYLRDSHEEAVMRWTPGGRSSDLGGSPREQRRVRRRGHAHRAGGAAVLLVLSLIFKQNFFALLGDGGAAAASRPRPVPCTSTPGGGEGGAVRLLRARRRAGHVGRLFQARARPTSTPSWCSSATRSSRRAASPQAATGPFYCPGDEQVYIDLGFYDELQQRFGAPGDFAQAYVLAHELGHHVQRLLGTEAQVREAQQRRPGARERSSRCGSSCRRTATPASGATRRSSATSSIPATWTKACGPPRPSATTGSRRCRARACTRGFTHGSSEQRASWFRRGFESGRPEDCDTFKS